MLRPLNLAAVSQELSLDSVEINKRPVSRKRRWLIMLIVVILLGASAVVWRQMVPTGLGGIRQVVPFLCFSQERGKFQSPDGETTLVVYTNDAGAGHSGLFPSWVMQEHWYGDSVVAKGYLEESRGPVPLKWTGSRTFTIGFMKGRYDDAPAPQTVTLH